MADQLPSADEFGLLPPGVHSCSWDEFQRRYVRFQRSDRRLRLFDKLRAYTSEIRSTGWACELIIDGSFVMECVDEPDDIDVVLVLPLGWDWRAVSRPFEYNVISRRVVRQQHRIDLKVVVAGSEAESDWLAFFEKVSRRWSQQLGIPLDRRKGLPRLTTTAFVAPKTSP